MNKRQEKVLIAALCGLVIVSVGAVAMQPAMANAKPETRALIVQSVPLPRI
nr:hypothetical protein [uncultured Devosia sp.]